MMDKFPPLFAKLEKKLTENAYLCGDCLTIADISAVHELHQTVMLGTDLSAYPKLNAWKNKILSLPECVEVLEPYNVFLAQYAQKQSSQSKPKCIYFPFSGRAEPIRMLCALKNI